MKNNNYLIFLVSLLFSTFLCWGLTGHTPRLHDILLIWCILNFVWLKPILFNILLFPLAILVWYIPVGLQYGYPNIGIIASIFETNSSEIWEFFELKIFLGYFTVILLFSLVLNFSYKVKATEKQKRFFTVFSILIGLLFTANIIYKDVYYSKVIGFFPSIFKHYYHYSHDSKQFILEKNKPDEWIVSSPNQLKYKNYILIMGESVQKNYMSAYKYPIETTPFLKNVKGIRYENFIAPAAYTVLSIPRMLAMHQETDVQYHNSIISLANKMGMNTYWISNQGVIGEYDSAVTYIAVKSKYQYYLKDKPSVNYFDTEMLPEIKRVLMDEQEGSRLIVIHLMGSHADFCSRVDFDKFHFKFEDERLSCYLSSINQTDNLIEKIYNEAKATQESFSIIYTADHGLTIDRLKHGLTQESLKVPLFLMSSDDNEQVTKHQYLSGKNFIWFLVDWFDVQVKNKNKLTKSEYEKDTNKDIWVFDNEDKLYNEIEISKKTVLMPDELLSKD